MVSCAGLRADDRDLLRTASAESYLFVLLDTGGAMRETPAGGTPPRRDDDPAARLWIAKAALTVALEREPDFRFGLATFPDQDALRIVARPDGGSWVELAADGGGGCSGWEPNDDRSEDLYLGYTPKWPTAPGEPAVLAIGDVLPMSWDEEHREAIRVRLAPNLALGESVPDVGVARYFAELPVDGQHRLLDERARPLVGSGPRPLGAALRDFVTWYEEWAAVAEEGDAQLGCRRLDLVLIAGGPGDCGGAPELVAAELLSVHGIRTHVVAVGSSDPRLDAIAVAGGTDTARTADGVGALEETLVDLLRGVRRDRDQYDPTPLSTGSTSRGAGAFVSRLHPVSGSPYWPGRLEAYLGPVPRTRVGERWVPDGRRRCEGAGDSGCLAWEAGESLLLQAPSAEEVAAGELRLGPGEDERRVFYAGAAGERLLLRPADSAEERLHLYGPGGMGLDPASPGFDDAGRRVIESSLSIKEAELEDRYTGELGSRSFVLGDVFHSQPVVVDRPLRPDYLAADVAGRLEPCGPRVDGEPESHLPYACFARRHRARRRVLYVGANDGALHAFDAGSVELDAGTGELRRGAGGGGELFAFVPRAALARIREAAEGAPHLYSVDGTVTVDDVLLPNPGGGPLEWRSVLVGGLRGGGRGYYALDVTQPDRLDADGLPVGGGGTVPSCLDGDAGCGLPAPYPELGDFAERTFPELLWELRDDGDEDGNGAADLAASWSRPSIGRVSTGEGDRFVAIFGGGLDGELERLPAAGDGGDGGEGEPGGYGGNFLYMVEVASGEILYKRRLDRVRDRKVPGSVPSAPAAIDVDGDGYLDTVYVGTTAGVLFKVDLRVRAAVGADGRLVGWEPFAIFDTGGLPIYHPPSVLVVDGAAGPALAFGAGDRLDLWSASGRSGRFYTFVDRSLTPEDVELPLTESALRAIHAGGDPDLDENLLLPPAGGDGDGGGGSSTPGWVLRLADEERLLARPRSVGGVLFFNTYLPSDPGRSPACGGAGQTRSYVVLATNANRVAGDDRFSEDDGLLAKPFIEVGLDAPPSGDGGGDGGDDPPGEGSDPCGGERLERIRAELAEELLPAGCRFVGRFLDVTALESASDEACVLSIPVCVLQRNWAER